MVLSSRFFEPFDQTYSEVTAVMRRSADGFAATRERDWLTRLIKEFQNERDAWPTIPSLAAYRDACARVRPRFLRLIVCAYLHISYDLPRVIADNWPGQDDWAAGPFEDRGEHIYFDLEPVFPDVLGQIAGRWSVMGGYSVVLRFVSRNLLRASSHWLLRLREAAWRHARTLSSQPDDERRRTEERMRRAMSAALDDVSNFRIWTGFLLEPPRTMPGRTILPVVLADFDRAWIGALLILGLIAAIGAVAFRIRHQADNMEAFIAEFGRRTERYVEMAVNEPSRFESIFADKSERGAPST